MLMSGRQSSEPLHAPTGLMCLQALAASQEDESGCKLCCCSLVLARLVHRRPKRHASVDENGATDEANNHKVAEPELEQEEAEEDEDDAIALPPGQPRRRRRATNREGAFRCVRLESTRPPQ